MKGNPDFRKEVKRALKRSASRTESAGSMAGEGEGGARPSLENVDENTPMLRSSTAEERCVNGHIKPCHGQNQSPLKKFFLNGTDTPGLDSDRRVVKWAAWSWHTVKVTLMSSYVNVLLVFVPLGILAGEMHWSALTVFLLNFFAIVPLAAVLAFATEEISIRLGQTLGGLLNATLGNTVELIVSIIALRQGQIGIVQSSMLGSILSNCLLVLGCAFIAGGVYNSRTGNVRGIEQDFNGTVASTMSSLLIVASASLIIPATLYSVISRSSAVDAEKNILTLSRGTAIIMLVLYVLYLVFQLNTHTKLFDAEQQAEDAEEEEETIGPIPAAFVLVVTTVLVAICADYLVSSISEVTESTGLSTTFIGLILLPIVGNAAEHVTAVLVALKDKMDLSLGIAIGSSMQISLLVTPSLVVLGWIIGQPMTLNFQTFETVVFFLSVLVVTYVIQDGKSNYLEGAMLVGLYAIIAVAFVVYPDNADGLAH